MMTVPFEPLSERTHDAVTNKLQRDINEACRWVLDAMQPGAPWLCPHCDVTTPRPEWVKSMRHVSHEAERRRRAAGGTGWLEGSIYSLAAYHLRDQGVLELEIGRGIRLSLAASKSSAGHAGGSPGRRSQDTTATRNENLNVRGLPHGAG